MQGDYSPGHDVMTAKIIQREIWKDPERYFARIGREKAMLKVSVLILALAIIIRG